MAGCADYLSKRLMSDRHFRGLRVTVRDGQVYSAGLIGGPRGLLGSLDGAETTIQTRRSHRVGASVDATVLLEPVGVLAAATRKDMGTAVIAFADGTGHTTRLDGKLAIGAAAEDAAGFNAMARSGAASPPAVRVLAEPVPAGRISVADFSAEQQFMIWRAKAGLRPGGTALDAAAGIRTGVWEDLNLSPCPAAIVVGDKRILIQCNMTGGYRRFDCEYRKSPMTPPPEFARQIAEHREPAEPERPTGDPASLPSANQAPAYSVAARAFSTTPSSTRRKHSF